MRLNRFSIEDRILNEKQIPEEEFITELRKCDHLVADVYFDGKLVFSSPVVWSESFNHLSAALHGRFALAEDRMIEQIIVRVHQSEYSDTDILISSTNLHEYIESGDQTASLFVELVDLCPDWSTKEFTPNSVISWQRTNVMNKKSFDDLPGLPSLDVEEDEE